MTERIAASLPANLPDYLARPDLVKLVVLLRHARKGAFAIALYNTVVVRDEVVAVLRTLVDPLPVYEYTMTRQRRNPLDYLKSLPSQAESKRAVIFIYDLDRANSPNQVDTTWGYLDAQREALIAYPHGLIFWLTEEGATQAARLAPNVWSRKSGIFDFRIESQPVLVDVRAEWSGRPLVIDSGEDLERLTRIYIGLLEEYSGDPNVPPILIAELHGKVAYLNFRAYQIDEALNHLKYQLDLARQIQSREIEAQARLNMGNIYEFRDERDAALESYAQALGLFRAVGDRLGEANVLKAMGDVQQFRDERDAALESYAQALGLFRAVGDRLGEANVLLSTGGLKHTVQDLVGARSDYESALQIYQVIGNQYSQGRALYRLGDCDGEAGEWSQAISHYQEAEALWKLIDMPDLAEQILTPRIQAARQHL